VSIFAPDRHWANAVALIFALIIAVAAPAPLAAQTGEESAAGFKELETDWNARLDSARAALETPKISEAELDDTRHGVERVRDEALAAYKEAEEKAALTDEFLDTLGLPPEEGQAPESGEVAEQRQNLEEELGDFKGRMLRADLVETRASRILGDFFSVRQSQLSQHLLYRGPSPLDPKVWLKAVPEFAGILYGLARISFEWLASGLSSGQGGIVFFFVIFGLGLTAYVGFFLRKWLILRFGRTIREDTPSYAHRLFAAIVEGVARGLIPSLVIGMIFFTLAGLGFLSAGREEIAAGLCIALVFLILVDSLSFAALAPDASNWAIAPLSPQNARAINGGITFLAVILAFYIFIGISLNPSSFSPELTSALGFVTNSLIAAGILFLLRRNLWRSVAADLEEASPLLPLGETTSLAPQDILKVPDYTWPFLLIIVKLAALTIPVWAIFGYSNFSLYIASNLVWSGVLIGGLWLARQLARETLNFLLLGDRDLPKRMRRVLTLSEKSSKHLEFWVMFTLNLGLIIIGLILFFPIWDISGLDISDWLQSSVIGLSLDRITVSMGNFFFAGLIFLAIYFATRWLQRGLEERILPQTRIDIGLRHSLKAAVGYIGLVVAALAALTSLGLSLTNLAIVAGALSVGIGFGLQNIVNNFVSGLILLVERPVKVGDWVVVGNHEGIIHRLNVRATEIMTFQHASVIVPNSQILSSAVLNWTHKDTRGRIEIKVGVAYGSDVEKVKEVLLEIAANHSDIQRIPEPVVLFKDFGDSALLFELRFFVPKIERRLTISSDIRFSIDAAFRAAKIEIPFPQTDIHIRSAEGMAGLRGTDK
jgi:potassium-dependent mechanosensitive channel